MGKERRKIGTVPIDEMKQEVNDFIEEVRENEPVLTESFESIDNPEYSEATVDSERRELSYRRKDGTKVEKIGLESKNIKAERIQTNSLTLSDEGMIEFQQALKDSGFKPGGACDWSEYISEDGDKPLVIPNLPKRAILNIISDFNLVNLSKVGRNGAQQGVNYDIPTQVEFWDMQGNYFKKWTLMSGQGNSTMSFDKKNIAFDFFDSSVYDSKGRLGKGDAFSVKFGNWVAQDSFHLKANIPDTFRVINNLSYRFYDAMEKTRGIKNDYVWKRALIDFSQIGRTAIDSEIAEVAVDTGARCFPDGFPVIVYQNGEFWGIFFMSLKKSRDNYHLNKKTPENIHLDGLLDDDFFMANGNIDWELFCSKKPNRDGFWDGIEVRNPKDLYCVDGEKYDADLHNEELIDENSSTYDSTNKDHVKTKKVKHYIEDFSKVMTIIDAAEQTYLASEKTAADLATLKAVFETYFDVDNLIDYLIHGDVTFNWDGFRGKNWQWFTYDGVKWYCGVYDNDSTFGYVGAAVGILGYVDGHTCQHQYCVPEHTLLFNRYILTYYTAELEARYAILRSKGVIAADYICDLFNEYVNAIGVDTYAKEWEKWTYAIPSNMPTPKDSVYRLHNWLVKRIQVLDSLYHYSD